MPQFRVHVASRDTGAESSIILTTADARSAAAHANDLGLMVKTVEEVPADPPAPASIDLVDLLSDALDDRRTYKRIRRLITRAVSEGVLVGIILAAIVASLLGSCLLALGAHR